jgi:hypothetical protein
MVRWTVENGEVRCGENPFNTLLFRYDRRGVRVYCRDCRDVDAGKRGKEHLITWLDLLWLALGLKDDQHGDGGHGHREQTES